MKGVTLTSFVMLCIVSWRFAKRDYSSSVPTTENKRTLEAIPPHVQISAPEQIFGAFEPVPSSEKIPVETANTKIEIGYLPSWANQWMTLREHQHTSWRILTILVTVIISVPIFLMTYRRVQSSKKNEKRGDKNVLLDLTALEALIQDFEERFGPLEKYADSQMMMKTAENKRDAQFQIENDSVKTNMNALRKIHSADQKKTGSIKIIEEKLPTAYQREVNSMNTMKMKIEEERLPQFSVEVEHEPHYRFQTEVESIDTLRKLEDERLDQVQKKVNSVEIIDKEKQQPAGSRYEVHSLMIQHKFHGQLRKGLNPLDVIEEEDEGFADSQNEVVSIKTMMIVNGQDIHDAKIQKYTDVMHIFEDEVAQRADSENEVDFIKPMMMEMVDELQNEMDSVEEITKEVYKPCSEVQKDVVSMETVIGEEDHPSCSQNELNLKTTTVKVEDESHAEVLNEMDLKEIIEEEGKDRADSQNAVNSIKTIFLNVRDEHLADSLNEVGSVSFMNRRLCLKHEEHTARDEVPKQSLTMRVRHKERSIKTSRTAGEIKKVRKNLLPHRSNEAVKAKVASQSNTTPMRGESQVKKTRHQKTDCSKVNAKIKT
jgi:hypothetical protein